MALEHQELIKLRKILVDSLSLEELETISFDAGIPWEELSGNTINSKAMSIVDRLRRYGLPTTIRFVQALDAHRPDLDLSTFGGSLPTDLLPPPSAGGLVNPTHAKGQEYENLNIRIDHLVDQKYLVRAEYSYGGGASQSEMREIDLTDPTFTELFGYLQKLVAEKSDAKELGRRLYEFLFPTHLHTLMSVFRAKLKEEGKGVRIRLQFGSGADALSRLPWEYAYDEQNNLFIAKDTSSPLVRFVERPYTPDSLSTGRELKVLLALASPNDQPELNIDQEERIVKASLDQVIGPVQLEVLRHATIDQLHDALQVFEPDVVHFVGHGSFGDGEGRLLFEKEDRSSHYVSSELLSNLFLNRGVKIVILNACNTAMVDENAPAFMSVAQGLVYAAVPAVFAMQFKVPDKLALRFTEKLYDQILRGEPLDRAVTEMRIAASLGTGPDDQVLWGIPVLFMRAPDGQIWDGHFSLQKPEPMAEPEPIFDAPDFSGVEASTDLERQIITFEQSLSAYYAQFEEGDREDVIDSIQDARQIASQLPINGRRVARKLDDISDVIQSSKVGLILLPTLQRLILTTRGGL